MRSIFTIGLIVILFSACDDGSEPYIPKPPSKPPVVTDTVKSDVRAKAMFDLITQHYKLSNGLYKESHPTQSGDPSISYLWPYVSLVSGAATLAELNYDVNYAGMSDLYEKYFRTGANGNSIGGYGSSTNGFTGGGTRFYDDNAIVGISLIEAYHITKEPRFLERAARIVPFLESGFDNMLGGAIWWNEDEKNISGNANSNKPACANGYATLFLLEYYKACPETERAAVLSFAKSLYKWLFENLRDPADKCYWNDLNTAGAVNKTKWTYNTGVMIQNGIRLYQITGEQRYLNEAIESAQGAYDFFVKTRNNIPFTYPDHDPWFNTKLLRGYIDLQPYYKNADNYIQAYYKFTNYGYDNARNSSGFFYEDWTGGSPKRYYILLMQAAVVESYGSLALYLKSK
ncbi:MAG: glycosyltransferase [Paludibacteraceae bacterium]|nr:glycosyltransferase [Paludibacteraceae bacterium]